MSLHAAPVNVAEGLRRHLFEKMHERRDDERDAVHEFEEFVTRAESPCHRERPLVTRAFSPCGVAGDRGFGFAQGAHLPHWTKSAVDLRDELPPRRLAASSQCGSDGCRDRDAIVASARSQQRPLSAHEWDELDRFHSQG